MSFVPADEAFLVGPCAAPRRREAGVPSNRQPCAQSPEVTPSPERGLPRSRSSGRDPTWCVLPRPAGTRAAVGKCTDGRGILGNRRFDPLRRQAEAVRVELGQWSDVVQRERGYFLEDLLHRVLALGVPFAEDPERLALFVRLGPRLHPVRVQRLVPEQLLDERRNLLRSRRPRKRVDGDVLRQNTPPFDGASSPIAIMIGSVRSPIHAAVRRTAGRGLSNPRSGYLESRVRWAELPRGHGPRQRTSRTPPRPSSPRSILRRGVPISASRAGTRPRPGQRRPAGGTRTSLRRGRPGRSPSGVRRP